MQKKISMQWLLSFRQLSKVFGVTTSYTGTIPKQRYKDIYRRFTYQLIRQCKFDLAFLYRKKQRTVQPRQMKVMIWREN